MNGVSGAVIIDRCQLIVLCGFARQLHQFGRLSDCWICESRSFRVCNSRGFELVKLGSVVPFDISLFY